MKIEKKDITNIINDPFRKEKWILKQHIFEIKLRNSTWKRKDWTDGTYVSITIAKNNNNNSSNHDDDNNNGIGDQEKNHHSQYNIYIYHIWNIALKLFFCQWKKI